MYPLQQRDFYSTLEKLLVNPADPKIKDETTEAIRTFNRRLFEDPRVHISLVPIGDGMTLALKLGS